MVCNPPLGCNGEAAVLSAEELNEQFREILKLHADLISITIDQKNFHKWAVPKICELEKRIQKLEKEGRNE